ncbi:methylated-DNA--[protein]-cysteine S-methyltransferase [Aquimarina agarilytica]|uniref:methylated-DNA--[protein]-cysteine S-methyltransferase n=1 Tax=Aquimarina agarilytica TaxID=1087449 RepID=UPI00028817E4|nr:methylated-DNA--[protein]-cysteine S-methyltransferase [Aquimarina agarilytica]
MSNSIALHYFKTPYGELVLGSFKKQLCLCDWRYRKQRAAVDARIKKGLDADFTAETSVVIEETKKQLLNYFNKMQSTFDIPLLFIGTDFQKTVWEALIQIPYGKTSSYLELSNQLNNPKAIRAIASANGANALSIIVPCHRIIGSNGDLVGYAGGLPTKKNSFS